MSARPAEAAEVAALRAQVAQQNAELAKLRAALAASQRQVSKSRRANKSKSMSARNCPSKSCFPSLTKTHSSLRNQTLPREMERIKLIQYYGSGSDAQTAASRNKLERFYGLDNAEYMKFLRFHMMLEKLGKVFGNPPDFCAVEKFVEEARSKKIERMLCTWQKEETTADAENPAGGAAVAVAAAAAADSPDEAMRARSTSPPQQHMEKVEKLLGFTLDELDFFTRFHKSLHLLGETPKKSMCAKHCQHDDPSHLVEGKGLERSSSWPTLGLEDIQTQIRPTRRQAAAAPFDADEDEAKVDVAPATARG